MTEHPSAAEFDAAARLVKMAWHREQHKAARMAGFLQEQARLSAEANKRNSGPGFAGNRYVFDPVSSYHLRFGSEDSVQTLHVPGKRIRSGLDVLFHILVAHAEGRTLRPADLGMSANHVRNKLSALAKWLSEQYGPSAAKVLASQGTYTVHTDAIEYRPRVSIRMPILDLI